MPVSDEDELFYRAQEHTSAPDERWFCDLLQPWLRRRLEAIPARYCVWSSMGHVGFYEDERRGLTSHSKILDDE
jgi:hypothetical protein